MSYDEEALAALGGVVCVFGVIALIWIVIMIIANWKVFTKAGEPGWKSIIPFYNYYTQIKICAPTLIFWIYLGCTVAGSIVGSFDNSFCSILSAVCSLAAFVMSVFANLKLSKAFGHGVGFAVGLILLNPIFMLILAFGSSQYDPMIDKETWY